jgi:hypothetical protein
MRWRSRIVMTERMGKERRRKGRSPNSRIKSNLWKMEAQDKHH